MKNLKWIGFAFVLTTVFACINVLAVPDYEHHNFVMITIPSMQKEYTSVEKNKLDYSYQYVEAKSYTHKLQARVYGPSIVGGSRYYSGWETLTDNWSSFTQIGNCGGNENGAGCAPGKVKLQFRAGNWQLGTFGINAGWYMDEEMYKYHISVVG